MTVALTVYRVNSCIKSEIVGISIFLEYPSTTLKISREMQGVDGIAGLAGVEEEEPLIVPQNLLGRMIRVLRLSRGKERIAHSRCCRQAVGFIYPSKAAD